MRCLSGEIRGLGLSQEGLAAMLLPAKWAQRSALVGLMRRPVGVGKRDGHPNLVAKADILLFVQR
jgi:hypothetical protein